MFPYNGTWSHLRGADKKKLLLHGLYTLDSSPCVWKAHHLVGRWTRPEKLWIYRKLIKHGMEHELWEPFQKERKDGLYGNHFGGADRPWRCYWGSGGLKWRLPRHCYICGKCIRLLVFTNNRCDIWKCFVAVDHWLSETSEGNLRTCDGFRATMFRKESGCCLCASYQTKPKQTKIKRTKPK